jgi:hypothetical protein
MSCKNDQDWEGSYVYKQQCVQWTDLVELRVKFNEFWDLLKKEEKQNSNKYGYSSETSEDSKEQIEYSLADIQGFCSVRFNESGNYDEVYFVITGGDIIRRIDGITNGYSYANQPSGQPANYGPWIVYLKDPCYGCTGFRFQNFDIEYSRSITCNDQYIDNIDPDPWKAQCIWPSCTGTGTVISDWQQYCHFNFDWRASYAQKFGDVAKKLFARGPICVPKDAPCTVSRNYCCNEYALAHYTEEYMDHSLCPQNETAIAAGSPQSAWPYRRRRLKWVSLGVNLTNPQDEEQPFDDETFFCCNNSITGGVFEGHVTQKISAIHLTDMWDRINTMVGGKPLRKCFYNQCKYYEGEEKKYRWLHKESVPMYASGSTADIMDRKDTCNNCDKTSVGANICACNFNDINALLDEYLAMECSCEGESNKYKGESLISVGSVTDCNCCKTKCCCDCKCEDDITEEECLKKQCKKNGPKWLGVYEKGDSKDDKKMGDNKPCGCFEGGDEPDPKFPDVNCMEICGKEAACCYDNNGSCCETLTKCDCDDKNGTWHGFRASDGSYKGTSWKKGDPKNCSDEDIQEIPDCGRVSACCNTETCVCDQRTKCACDEAPFVWQGLTGSGESKACDDASVKDKIECGVKGACCGTCFCYQDTKCSCESSGGNWKGKNTECDDWEADSFCSGLGACCYTTEEPAKTCEIMPECECTLVFGGYFKGVGSGCDGWENDPNCGDGDPLCGACAGQPGNPNLSIPPGCDCCPSEDGCDCPGDCCCCPRDEAPENQTINGQETCVCVTRVCNR